MWVSAARWLGMALLLSVHGLPDALAQDAFPTRPIRLVVGGPPGGSGEVVTRLLAERMADSLGQRVIVENRDGASGQLAAEHVARARPDGYTLLLGQTATLVVAPVVEQSIAYDPLRDFAPIALMGKAPLVIVVRPGLGARDLAGLVALLRAAPERYSFGNPGDATQNRIVWELLLRRHGLRTLNVNHRGATPMVTSLVGGHVDIAIATAFDVAANVQVGRLVALAVLDGERAALLPDVPTLGEAGFAGLEGQESWPWSGLFAPAATSPEIIARLSGAMNWALQQAELRQRIAELGGVPLGGTPEETRRFVERQIAAWTPIIQSLNLRP